MKLMMSDFNVQMVGDSATEFTVLFRGPKDSPYEGGVWKVHVELPPTYPYKSPSIGFMNKIYHPNVDEHSGSVCLDVINQTWSPMFDLINVFEVFLPQLLLYPNPTDPLNGEAAAMLLKYEDRYKGKVAEYVRRYASEEAAMGAGGASLASSAVNQDDDNNTNGNAHNGNGGLSPYGSDDDVDPMANFEDL